MEFIIRLILFGSQSQYTLIRTSISYSDTNKLTNFSIFLFQFHFSLSTKATTIRLRWLSTASDVSSSQHVSWISIWSIQLLSRRQRRRRRCWWWWRREKMIKLDFQTTTKKTKTILTKHDKKRQTEQKNFSTKIQFDDLHNSTTITNRTNTYGQQQQIHTLVNTFNAKDLIHA